MAGWQSGHAADCKSVYAGSIPASASIFAMFRFFLRLYFKIQDYTLKFLSTGATYRDPNTILVFRMASLGDFLSSIPALKKIRKNFPNSKIVLIYSISLRQQYENLSPEDYPWLDFIEEFVDEIILLEGKTFLEKIRKLRKSLELHRKKYTFIFLRYANMPFYNQLLNIIFFRLTGIFLRINGAGIRSNNNIFQRYQSKNMKIEHNCEGPVNSLEKIIDASDLEIEAKDFCIEKEFIFRDYFQKELSKITENEIKVAIFAGSKLPHKRWPVDKFIRLLKEITKKNSVKFILFGMESDIEISNKIYHSLPDHTIDFTGRTSIVDTYNILLECDLCIGNDGGSMHLASVAQCPAIAIMNGINYRNFVNPYHSADLCVYSNFYNKACHNYTTSGNCNAKYCNQVSCRKHFNNSINAISVNDVLLKFDLFRSKY